MPPDVAIISTYPPPGITHGGHSGVASYTANLARALTAWGAEVAVVAPATNSAPDDHSDGDVAVRRVSTRGPLTLPALTRHALGMDAPTVHLQHETFLFGGLSTLSGMPAAMGSIRRSGTRSVVTVHQVVALSRIDREFTRMHRIRVPPTISRLAMGSVQKSLLGSFDRAIVHQHSFAKVLHGAEVIPHGVEDAPAIDPLVARRTLELDDDRLLVLCFGFIAPYKGLELALEAAARIPEMRLVVAGGTHPRLGRSYARALRQRWGSVADFTGHVPDDQVPLWHAAADLALFCYPAPHAASGAVALALAHRTPFLATSPMASCLGVPVAAEVRHDLGELTRRLRALAEDRSGLVELTRACQELATESTWPSVARRHLNLYEEVLGAERSGRRTVRNRRSG